VGWRPGRLVSKAVTMNRSSLRTRLLADVVLALVPVLGLSAWHAYDSGQAGAQRRSTAVTAAAELAIARQREVIEGTKGLLIALASAPVVQRAIAAQPTPADIDKCNAYLKVPFANFPGVYSAAFVTDASGVGKCATVPAAIGSSFADRAFFKQVQQAKQFFLASYVASRLTTSTVIPAVMPILADGEFRGFLAIGIALDPFANLQGPPAGDSPDGGEKATLNFVDRSGRLIGGTMGATRALPIPARIVNAIETSSTQFTDYGSDGEIYDYRLIQLAPDAVFEVVAIPAARPMAVLIADWSGFALLVLALAAALIALWFGADRWCLKPLRYIRHFANAVARGETTWPELVRHGSPEIRALANDILLIAQTIAKREGELRASIEQRDHMLREIHHRVKNNLQMISSLLSLQAGKIRSSRIRRHFTDAQNRVLALSILHRHLYERSSWALVDFQQFISDLVRQLTSDRQDILPAVRFHIRAPVMAVGPDTAIPVGLIVTEAVTNAMRHAFQDIASPEIRIIASQNDGQVELLIEDNGVGWSGAQLGPDEGDGFGFTLIRGLATQLGGDVELAGGESQGARVVIRFPLPDEVPEDAPLTDPTAPPMGRRAADGVK
jgi:two-component sensor histidine kinase